MPKTAKIAWGIFVVAMVAGCAVRPAITDGQTGKRIAQTALRYQGFRYRYGGREPTKGFDCSGLVQFVHRQQGIAIPRTAKAQWSHVSRVSKAEMGPGDLVFFRVPGNPWHVGIYLGQGQFLHAPRKDSKVRVESLNRFWRRHFRGAGRYWK